MKSATLLGFTLLLLVPALSQAASTAERDPQALAALSAMGGYLHSLNSFTLGTRSETDQQLDSGQTIAFQHYSQVQALRPDKLAVRVEQNAASRQFFYDGQGFTLYDSRLNYYAKGLAPNSIAGLLDLLSERYAIELPLAELFRWNQQTADAIGISQAYLIGKDNIDGQSCSHYAYRQPDIDWQLWLRDGAAPLPCRLIIIRRDDPERPRHSVTFNWDLSSPISPTAFTFTPPAKALQVPLVQLQPGGQP